MMAPVAATAEGPGPAFGYAPPGASREEIVQANERLVWRYVNQYADAGAAHGFEREDLFGYGVLGLLHALDRFEPGRGNRFTTYAATCIRGYILHALNRRGDLRGYAYRSGLPFRRIDADAPLLLEDGETTWGDLHLVDDGTRRALEWWESARPLHAALGALEHRTRRILERHFFGGETLVEIGADPEIGLSAGRVQQLVARALSTLAAHLTLRPVRAATIEARLEAAREAEWKAREAEEALARRPLREHRRGRILRTEWRSVPLPDGRTKQVAVRVCAPAPAEGARRARERL